MNFSTKRVDVLAAKLRYLPSVGTPRRVFMGVDIFEAFRRNAEASDDTESYIRGNVEVYRSTLLEPSEILSLDEDIRKIFTPQPRIEARLDGTINLNGRIS